MVAFTAGLLSFVSPCVLPLVPVYLGSLAGPAILEGGRGENRLPIFLHSLSFVAGFSLVFTILGAGAGLLGLAISTYTVLLRQVAGILLIILGLFMLLALVVPRLNFERRLNTGQPASSSYIRSLLTGSIFSLGWTPCIGPILGGILTLAIGGATAWKGAYLLAIYSLGLGLPFLIIGAAFDMLRPLLRRLYQYTTIIRIIGSLVMIAIGILILTNQLALFAS